MFLWMRTFSSLEVDQLQGMLHALHPVIKGQHMHKASKAGQDTWFGKIEILQMI